MSQKRKSEFTRELQSKRLAYNRVFDKANVYTEEVLKDLAKFCRAHQTAFHADARMHAVLEGRREVWLRIQEFLNLPIEELYNLRVVAEIKQEQD